METIRKLILLLGVCAAFASFVLYVVASVVKDAKAKDTMQRIALFLCGFTFLCVAGLAIIWIVNMVGNP